MADLTRVPAPDPLAVLTPDEAARVRAAVNEAWSPETRRAYGWGWRVWSGWAAEHEKIDFPADPGAVALWLTDQPTVATAMTVIAAIRWRHHAARVFSPTDAEEVKMALKALRRTKGTAPRGRKAAVTLDDLARLLDQVDRATCMGARDAALLLVGWHAALRRSELVGLNWNDVEPSPGGITLRIRRSKTDQEGAGQVVGVGPVEDSALCAIRALEAWRKESLIGQIGDGPIFRACDAHGALLNTRLSAKSAAEVVKRCGAASGLDPARLGGHSLRSGFVTEAYRRGASDAEIMGTTRHENSTMLKRYKREADPVAQGASRRMNRKPTEEK
jgi:integrase